MITYSGFMLVAFVLLSLLAFRNHRVASVILGLGAFACVVNLLWCAVNLLR